MTISRQNKHTDMHNLHINVMLNRRNQKKEKISSRNTKLNPNYPTTEAMQASRPESKPYLDPSSTKDEYQIHLHRYKRKLNKTTPIKNVHLARMKITHWIHVTSNYIGLITMVVLCRWRQSVNESARLFAREEVPQSTWVSDAHCAWHLPNKSEVNT